MSTTISALPAATALTGTEALPIVQGGTTKRLDPDQLIDYINSYFESTPLAADQGGTGVTSIAALLTALIGAGAYAKSNAVGTVSQTGGVPTGAIIGTATNANGTYTKWTDGTMVCTRTVALGSVSISTVGGSIFYQTFGAIPFAATFSAAPVVQMSAISSGGLAWVAMGSALPSTTATQAYFVVVPVSGTYTVTVQLTASGRWF
jgi:hypothetical protein